MTFGKIHICLLHKSADNELWCRETTVEHVETNLPIDNSSQKDASHLQELNAKTKRFSIFIGIFGIIYCVSMLNCLE